MDVFVKDVKLNEATVAFKRDDIQELKKFVESYPNFEVICLRIAPDPTNENTNLVYVTIF